MAFDPKLRSPKERPLFVLAALVSTVVWLLAIVGTLGVGLAYILVGGFFFLAAHAVFLAHVRGNGVRVTRHQLPQLHTRTEAIALKLGMERLPEVYPLQQGGILNAFATKLLSRRCVIIYSELVAACADPRQLDFIVGHELGHLAAGHLAWNAYLAPFHILPWLGPAYSRAREYTGDRCGLAAVGALDPALRGLGVLAAGGALGQQIDLEVFASQRLESGRFWMATAELCMSHPYLCKRVAALQEVQAPGTIPSVRRNPFAYPLAPLLGLGVGGGPAMAFVVIVTLLVIAVPNFLQFRERSLGLARPAPADQEPDRGSGDDRDSPAGAPRPTR